MDAKYKQCYQMRLERLVKLIELDAPAPIIGHAALLIADLVLPETVGRKNLIRYLLKFERKATDYAIALDDPNSEESKEYREIEKELDDIEIDELCRIQQLTATPGELGEE